MNKKYILLAVLVLLFIIGIARNNNFHFLDGSGDEIKTTTNNLTVFATMNDFNNLNIDYSQNYDLIVEKQKEDFNVIGHIRSISVNEEDQYLNYAASIDYLPVNDDLTYELSRDLYNRIRHTSGDFFYVGLTLPNFKQLIGINNNMISGDDNFVKTMVSRAMINQYIKLREIYSTEFCNQNKFNEEWLSELKKSPYYGELKLNNFKEYPRLDWKLWIVPSKVTIEISERKAFLKNFSLKSNIVINEAWLDLSQYHFNKEVKDDLNLRLSNWKSFAVTELNKNKVDNLVNNDERFNTLKSAYSSLALAQWYKKLNTTKHFTNYLNSEDTVGLEYAIPFVEQFYEQQLSGTGICDISGGISFKDMPLEIKNLSKTAEDAFQNDIYSWFRLENKVYITGGFYLNFPDLEALAIGYSTLNPESGENFNITVVVRNNKQSLNVGDFTIAFFDQYIAPNGEKIVHKIGESSAYGLIGDEVKLYSILWNTSLVGEHNLFAVVDYYNGVLETNEMNNVIGLEPFYTLEVDSGYPVANLYSFFDNQLFLDNETVTLAGYGTDYQDDELNESLYNWTSNVDDYLGSGSILYKNLSIGNHIISFSVIDSDNLTSTSQVPIHVFPQGQFNPANKLLKPKLPNITKEENKIIIHPHNPEDQYEYQLDFGKWINIGNGTIINLPTLEEDFHAVLVRVIDYNGWIGEPSEINFFVDMTPPLDPILREELFGLNRWTNNPTPFITWIDPGDTGSGVDHYLLSIDEGNFTNIGKNLSIRPTFSTGHHTIGIMAVDRMNLSQSYKPIDIYVDTAPPSPPKVKLITHLFNDEVTFEWNVSEDDTGISGYYYVIDKKSDTIPTILSGEWTNKMNYTFIPIEKEDFYFHIIAVDNLGNVGDVATHHHFKRNILQKIMDWVRYLF